MPGLGGAHGVWAAARLAVMALAVAPLGYYVLAMWSAREFFRKRGRGPGGGAELPAVPPVSILKPCRGLDREAYENFASLCRQDYPQFEILFAVGDRQDPAVPVIEKVIRDFPSIPIRLLDAIPAAGTNSKVNKLARLAAEARHDLLVVNDSDIRVRSDYLRQLAAAFADPEVGAATAMYVGRTAGSLGAELEAVGVSTDFQAGVLCAWKLEGGVKFALGATMACTRKALEAIGGFAAIADDYADDYELGHQIVERGYRVALLRDPVEIIYPRMTFGEFFAHQVRWSLATRSARPWGHLGLLFTFGLPWAVAAACAAPSGAVAAAYLGAWTVLRFGVVLAVAVRGLGDTLPLRKAWLVPLRDACAFAVWIAGYFRTRINWRGLEFVVKRGKLVPVEAGRQGTRAAPAAR